MDFVQQYSRQNKSLGGLVTVVLLHALILYALIWGLTRTNLPHADPPPAKIELIEQPKPMEIERQRLQIELPQTLATITPQNIDLPDLPLQQPAPLADQAPPSLPRDVSKHAIASDPGPTTELPFHAGPPSAARQDTPKLGVVCPNSDQLRANLKYPVDAIREGISIGEVIASFTVGADGAIKNIAVISSTHRAFSRAVVSAIKEFSCIGQGRDVEVQVPVAFKIAGN